jgi:radical SAM superfamily enzyme YgiQ (UPF0313 family)
MKICLIIPPSSFLIDERVFMSLGILRIAAVLELKGIQVDVLDLSGIKNFTEVISDYVRMYKDTKYYGLTATTPQMPSALDITNVIRVENSEAKVILGGSHITLVNAAYRNEIKKNISGRATKAMESMKKYFDHLIAGDGEDAIFLVLKESAPMLIDADSKDSDLFLNNLRLESLPFPARHLVDVKSYNYTIDGVRALSLIAQLGCPFACGFCGGRMSPMLRHIRTRTSKNIVREMEFLYNTYGITGFMFYDDELNVNQNIIELMQLIKEAQQNLDVEWKLRGFIKAELFTQEQADAMYEAGFRWILVGFESGSHRILKNINKKATRDDNTQCMKYAHNAGLKVKALMSIGHPGESKGTILETKAWLLEVKPDDFDVTIITCYPGTPYFDEASPLGNGIYVYTYQKTGDKLYQIDVDHSKVADYYKGDIEGGYHSYVYTDFINPEELVIMRNKIEIDVRKKLNIPFNQGMPSMLYEHSMGQRFIPSNILRSTKTSVK